jgi:hypothetical protein
MCRRGTLTDSGHNLLLECTRLKRNTKFQKGKPAWDLEKRKKVQDTLEEKLDAIECGSVVEQYQQMCFRYYE